MQCCRSWAQIVRNLSAQRAMPGTHETTLNMVWVPFLPPTGQCAHVLLESSLSRLESSQWSCSPRLYLHHRDVSWFSQGAALGLTWLSLVPSAGIACSLPMSTHLPREWKSFHLVSCRCWENVILSVPSR